MNFDKSHLPPEKIEKQKMKGTYDSPCMSVCDYASSVMAASC